MAESSFTRISTAALGRAAARQRTTSVTHGAAKRSGRRPIVSESRPSCGVTTMSRSAASDESRPSSRAVRTRSLPRPESSAVGSACAITAFASTCMKTTVTSSHAGNAGGGDAAACAARRPPAAVAAAQPQL